MPIGQCAGGAPKWVNNRPAGPPYGRRDTGSIPLALLITMVGISLSGLLSSMVINQIQTTRITADRVQGINAALAGLDVGLANIRAAYDAVGGNRTKLPCGPLSGTVDPANPRDSAHYEVTPDYYRIDPSGYQDNLAAIAASRITCLPGAGTTSVPAYALLQARGTGNGDRDHNGVLDTNAGPWRSLFATYTFSTKDENIPGGPIAVSGTTYCLGSAIPNPVPGTPVTTVACTPLGIKNTFIYPRNLTLVLARTRTAALPGGLCVHGAAQTDGAPITFQPCSATTDFHQQWEYYTAPFAYMGTADGTSRSSFCLNVEPANALNASVVVRGGAACAGSAKTPTRSFEPSPLVGAGAAGATTGQLVNRQEVGRCIDLPRDDVTGQQAFGSGTRALITFPCKQAFNGNVHWNHKWKMPTFIPGEYTAEGRISVTPAYDPTIGETPDPENGIEYCMKSAGLSGGAVWVAKCSAGGAALTWTIYSRAPLVDDAYQITDIHGNCLQSVGPTASAAQKLDSWSFVITAPCDGSDLQKWNVPADWTNAPLKNLGEE